jgi:hypothetical protein
MEWIKISKKFPKNKTIVLTKDRLNKIREGWLVVKDCPILGGSWFAYPGESMDTAGGWSPEYWKYLPKKSK